MARKNTQPVMERVPIQQKDGYWHYYWTQEGRKRHISAQSQMDCILAYYQKYKDIAAGLVDVNPNTPVKHWAQQWLDTYKQPKNLTDKSRDMYRQKLNKYILPIIGTRPLKSVTELHLQQIMNDSAGMSSSHLKKLRCVMRELFGKAYDLGYIPRNPAAGLELPAGTKGERRSLTPLEQEAFDAICTDGLHRGCLFYQMMLYCGLRPGECAALEWRHIDFDAAQVSVEQAKESGSTRIKAPKTESGIRVVPILPEFLEKLRATRGFPTAPFPRQNGTAHTDSSLRAMWTSWKREMDKRMAISLVRQAHAAKTAEEAECILMKLSGDFSPRQLARKVQGPDYTGPEKIVLYRNQLILHGESADVMDSLVAYDLRHTYCTNLQKAGVDLKTASYLMGHSDIQTTANIYSHTDAELIGAAAEKIKRYAAL